MTVNEQPDATMLLPRHGSWRGSHALELNDGSPQGTM